MRRNGFRIFFHNLQRVNKRNHQKQKQNLKLLKVSPLLLLVLSGVIIMTNFPQQNNITGESQAIFPKSSGISFLDTMHVNQTLEYQTNYNITSGNTCTAPDENVTRYTVFNNTQDIIYNSENDVLKVNETFDYQNYTYIITSTSNIPTNQEPKYIFEGGWQHNYPVNEANIKLNAQEITFGVLSHTNQIILDFKFEKNMNLTYDEISIPTKVFNATSNFMVDFDDG